MITRSVFTVLLVKSYVARARTNEDRAQARTRAMRVHRTVKDLGSSQNKIIGSFA